MSKRRGLSPILVAALVWSTAAALLGLTAASPPAAAETARPATALTGPAHAASSAAWTSPGYWLADSAGAVFAEGGAVGYGSLAGLRLSAPVVGMAATPDGRGYWLVAAGGGVFAFGDARYLGSAAAHRRRSPVVGMAATPDGRGYWLVAAGGGVFTFGDAGFHGSAAAAHLLSPVVALAATPSGQGYWMVTARGQVLTFGDAGYFGSPAASAQSVKVRAFAPTPSGHGYWVVTANGTVLSYGDAGRHGSAAGHHPAAPMVGVAPTPDGRGYLLAGAGGGVFSFGDAVYAGRAPHGRAVAVVAVPPHPAPVVAAFYYPWYASVSSDGEWRHWNEGGHHPPEDIGSDFYPAAGAYSSGDPAVVSEQMAEMAAAGIDEVVVSWWGEGSYEDEHLPLIDQEAVANGLRVAVQIEPYPGRSPTSVGQDITYLRASYDVTSFFVYSSQDFTSGQWAPVLDSVSGVTVWAESFWDHLESGTVQAFAGAAGFQGVYTYDPYDIAGVDFSEICGAARMDHLLCSPSVAPGYSAVRATGNTEVRARHNGATYDDMWLGAVDSDPDVVSITSFNEWHEGSQIEPAASMCLSGGSCYRSYQGAYGLTGAAASDAYLDRTADWVSVYRQRELGPTVAGAAIAAGSPLHPAAAPAAAPAVVGATPRQSVAPTAWTISTVAGSGQAGSGLALVDPVAVATDAAGDLFMADAGTDTVDELPVGATALTVVAGTGTAGFSGDGGPATSAQLFDPRAVAVDALGDVFVADFGNDRVREVSAGTRDISTVAGGGGFGPSPDGTPAAGAALEGPSGVAVDSAGNVYVAETDANRIRKVDASNGLLSTVAGNGAFGSGGNGGPAVDAQLAGPMSLAIDGAGDLLVTEPADDDVREIRASGVISTVAGSGAWGDRGDNGPARRADLDSPMGVAVDSYGNVFVSDADNQQVREVAVTTGVIYPVAGTDAAGFTGDGGAAVSADLHDPEGLAVGPGGTVYVADSANHRVRAFVPPTPDGCAAVLPAGQTVGVTGGPGTDGYRLAASDGAVAAVGSAACLGSELGRAQAAPAAGVIATPDGNGYWVVSRNGDVSAFGDAGFFGSLAGKRLDAPIVGLAATPDGRGYWLVASDGGVFSFGDAPFLGSAGGVRLVAPIVGLAADPNGRGYWLVAADGGVFTYGNAPYLGSDGGARRAVPVVGMAAAPGGGGYWLVTSDGDVSAFGSAPLEGSAPPAFRGRVVGMAATPDGRGYWLAADDGAALIFGDAGPAAGPVG